MLVSSSLMALRRASNLPSLRWLLYRSTMVRAVLIDATQSGATLESTCLKIRRHLSAFGSYCVVLHWTMRRLCRFASRSFMV